MPDTPSPTPHGRRPLAPAHSRALSPSAPRPVLRGRPTRPIMRSTLPAALALALIGGLAACGAGDAAPASTQAATAADTTAITAPATTAPATTAAASHPAAAGLQVSDAWAKAAPDISAMPMTGIFGVVRNTGTAPVVLVSATTSASRRTELHTTVTGSGAPVMKAVSRLTIPAGGSLVLKPGGDHLMVLDMTTPLAVGDPVRVTLRTQEGADVTFDVVAKAFAGAQEPYPSTGPAGMTPEPTPAS